MPPENITDVLGRFRPVARVWDGGAWQCPFCFSAVEPVECRGRAAGYGAECSAVHCQNPACFANAHYPAATAREKLAEAEARDREDAQRKRNHAAAMARGEESRAARAARTVEIRAEARTRGACERCALHDSEFRAPKYTKHRGACPRERRAQ